MSFKISPLISLMKQETDTTVFIDTLIEMGPLLRGEMKDKFIISTSRFASARNSMD